MYKGDLLWPSSVKVAACRCKQRKPAIAGVRRQMARRAKNGASSVMPTVHLSALTAHSKK